MGEELTGSRAVSAGPVANTVQRVVLVAGALGVRAGIYLTPRSGRKMRTIVAAAILSFATGSASWPVRLDAQTLSPHLRNMVGMPPLDVYIFAGSEADRAPLDISGLRSAVELKLRQNRIAVLTDADRTTSPRSFFNVAIRWMFNGDSTQRVYSYELYVDEAATLKRNGMYAPAPIWPFVPILGGSGAGFGYVGVRLDFAKVVREEVLKAMDAFLNDYLTANPLR